MVSTSRLRFQVTLINKILLVSIFFVMLTHAVGVLLPETGFDALWYHLPIVKDMAASGVIRNIPGVIQSSQPRLGEIFFLPWFVLWGTTGVKFSAFLLVSFLLVLVYKLARNYLKQAESLLLVLLVSTFHTVAWQASSGYVDILRTIFDVGILALLALKTKSKHESILVITLVLGSVLTKLVALLFLPALLVYICLKRNIKLTFFCLVIVIFFYILGQYPVKFIFSVSRELIGFRQVLDSFRSLVLLPLELSFHRESYLSPIFLFAVPFFIALRRRLWREQKSELIFIALSLLTWVFVVPVSVRYDLSAIMLLTIICFVAVGRVAKNNKVVNLCLLAIVLGTVALNMSVRIGVIARAMPYLIGNETQDEYLSRFNNGILSGPLENWYRVQ